MACKNCNNDCIGGGTSDRCVQYTGDDIPLLGICNGDLLSEVEEIILNKLLTYTDGTGIVLSTITTRCTFLADLFEGKPNTLSNLIQLLIDGECSLRELIANIETVLGQSISFETSCLTTVANPTKDQILQAAVNKICELNTRVVLIESDYVKNSNLNTLIQQYFNSQTSVQEYTKLPKYFAIPYHGPLSVFDSTGKGIAALGYDKVYLCIGQTVNGFTLPDYRGRSPMGVNVNIPSSGMDSAVNPAIPGNSAYSLSVNNKKGEFTHLSSLTETASHSHPTPTYSYNLRLPGQRGGDNNDNGNTTAFAGGDKAPDETNFNFTLTVPITVPTSTTSAVGGNQPHNNLAPVVGANFAMYVP